MAQRPLYVTLCVLIMSACFVLRFLFFLDYSSRFLEGKADKSWYESVVAQASSNQRSMSLLAHLVFIHERDLCFVSHLKGAADGWDMVQEGRKKVVVGVFGVSHIRGVRKFLYHDFDDDDLWNVGNAEAWARTDRMWFVENCEIKNDNWLQ